VSSGTDPTPRFEPPPESRLDRRVVVRASPIEGLGLFSIEPIREDDTVSVLGGAVIGDAEGAL
jgi:hypothetical protein